MDKKNTNKKNTQKLWDLEKFNVEFFKVSIHQQQRFYFPASQRSRSLPVHSVKSLYMFCMRVILLRPNSCTNMDTFSSSKKSKISKSVEWAALQKKVSKLVKSHKLFPFTTPVGSRHRTTIIALSVCLFQELGNGAPGSPTTRDEVLVAPLSVQPTRKAKCSTLSLASLRRL